MLENYARLLKIDGASVLVANTLAASVITEECSPFRTKTDDIVTYFHRCSKCVGAGRRGEQEDTCDESLQ